MAERPILFSGPMVRAILSGEKTVTRRVIKPQPDVGEDQVQWVSAAWQAGFVDVPCPYGQPGDRLWVRETWGNMALSGYEPVWAYRADDAVFGADSLPPGFRWRPSIHMPRWACRLLLDVVSVRVERLQGITDEDAHAEGIAALDGTLDEAKLCARAKAMGQCPEDARVWFAELWDSINAKCGFGWNTNPWVWRVEFRRQTNA